MITWWVTTVYSYHVKYPTVTWRSKWKIKGNNIQRPWHLRGGQSWLGITGDVRLGKRKAGQGRSGNLSSIESWLRNNIVCRRRGECPCRLSVFLYSPLRGGPHPQAGGNRVMSCISSAVALWWPQATPSFCHRGVAVSWAAFRSLWHWLERCLVSIVVAGPVALSGQPQSTCLLWDGVKPWLAPLGGIEPVVRGVVDTWVLT